MTLRRLVSGAEALLLDFDGPICSVFAGYPASAVAEELRGALSAKGVRVPLEISSPHVLYAWAATRHQELASWLDDLLTAREVDAIHAAAPTPHADNAVDAASAAGLPVAIVSNNAESAVRWYLGIRGIGANVAFVIGRPHGDPSRMKPHPAIVEAATSALGVARSASLFVGDATTDMEAANRAGVLGIGYAKAPERRAGLVASGAKVVIDGMDELATAIKAEL